VNYSVQFQDIYLEGGVNALDTGACGSIGSHWRTIKHSVKKITEWLRMNDWIFEEKA
jgi:hypothetical protein